MSTRFTKIWTPSTLTTYTIKFIGRARSLYLVNISSDYPKFPKVDYRNDDVYTIVEQVWKRKVYFQVFHKDVKGMNELKEATLYCFWILKLQPFYLYGSGNKSTNKLNAKMAMNFLILGMLVYAKNMNIKNEKKAKTSSNKTMSKMRVNLNSTVFEDLFYSFQFRDWSKESLMDLCAGLIITEEVQVTP